MRAKLMISYMQKVRVVQQAEGVSTIAANVSGTVLTYQ